jgi:molybdopterin-containing oxidoreductase family iron-sulfur binding subunit
VSERAARGAGCGGATGAARRERVHWRSLEALAGSEEARAYLEREFPAGASEPPAGIDRRALVQLLGAALSLAGLAACRKPVETIVPFVTPPEDLRPGVPKRYATAMPFGLGALGLLVESHEGRPTKVEGNELHPASRGAASALAQASILGLYDPDRSRRVLKQGAAASWSDFVAAWSALDERHLASGGAGLAVLSPPSSSPTLFRLAAAGRARFPALRWASWEPVAEENLLAGAALATGRPLVPAFDLGAAQVVLALDADLFLGEREAVAYARGFAAGRPLARESDGMNRLYAVESALTTTGAMADHRLALPSARVGGFALALAAALADAGADAGLPPGIAASVPREVPRRWLEALARDLLAHRGRSLVIAGRDQPPAVHALALAMNFALGNVGGEGAPVTLAEPADLLRPSAAELSDLVAAMGAGSIATLVVLGGNPVFTAPADLGFEAALARVETVVHLGLEPDETAQRSTWHLPEAHFLEAWGDCRAADGTASVVQPLVAPLFDGKSAVELLQLVATGEEKPGYDAVRETWATLVPAADDPMAFEGAWNRALHDGLLAGSALPPAAVELARPLPLEPLAALAAAAAADSGGLELVFRPSPAVWDGRFANVGWLQELPDAISKQTWGNAALVAPETAAGLGLGNEDGVRLRLAGSDAAVELPVWIVPGQAAGTVVVHLGYGRRAAGRIGTGVGADAYPLRRSGGLGFAAGAALEPSGQSFRVAQTQDHGTMAGRPIVREATLAEWRREPRFAEELVEVPAPAPLVPEHDYTRGPQWAMTVDLALCTGCNACVVACQSENNVPIVGHEQVRRGREMHWLRVDRYYSGPPERPEVAFQPVPCMQCENAPCEQVCPVAATVHTADGLNAMVYNRCIGTRYCSNNCPYKVRRFNFFNYTKDTPELLALAANPEVTVRSRGVMEKCTYCVQRIQRARIEAKLADRPLRDGDVVTACQQTCPTKAIVFGDLRDPESALVERKARSRNYVLLAELGNRPRTSYLARIRNPHPDLAEAHG